MFNLIFKIERWKYNSTYQVYVSTQGRFRNKSKADIPVKIGTGGYCLVKVECSTCEYMLAHRLVMLTWKPTSDAENLTVDHLDHNKRNNALSNLEWVSWGENQERAKDDLVATISKATFNKLVEAEVSRRLGAVIPLQSATEYKNDITVFVGADRVPMTLGTFVDLIWARLSNRKFTKTQYHQMLKDKVAHCKKSKQSCFTLAGFTVYFI